MNLTAFRYEVEDFQLPSAFVQANGAITFITRNFAGLENRGLEAEFLYQPTDALTLFMNLGFQDAKYVDLDPSILAQQARCRAALAGTPQPPQSTNPRVAALADCSLGIVNDRGEIADPVRTPDTIAAGGSYRIDVGGFSIEPTLTWTRVGSQTLATAGNPVGRTDAFSTWTAGVRFDQVGGPWSARLACQNCGDAVEKHTVLSQLPYLIEPRTWSFDVIYRF
jgi:iron complex outermembrane receptor protein